MKQNSYLAKSNWFKRRIADDVICNKLHRRINVGFVTWWRFKNFSPNVMCDAQCPRRKVTYSKFHQHFTSSFCADILSLKLQSQTVIREKLHKAFLYEKGKVLMKLTPARSAMFRQCALMSTKCRPWSWSMTNTPAWIGMGKIRSWLKMEVRKMNLCEVMNLFSAMIILLKVELLDFYLSFSLSKLAHWNKTCFTKVAVNN